MNSIQTSVPSYPTTATSGFSGRKHLNGAIYIQHMIDDFIELHGDRRFGDDAAIIGGIGYINDIAVTVIAMECGSTVEERAKRKFGCPAPEGYRKALRLMKEAEKFGRPVICIMGNAGAYRGMDAEMRGQGEAIAENLLEMMGLRVPIISVITGNKFSSLAPGICDSIIMLETAVHTANSGKFSEQNTGFQHSFRELLNTSIVEHVILNHTTKKEHQIYDDLKHCIYNELIEKQKLPTEILLEKRYQKFRRIDA